MKDISHKVIIITGASSGIGRACALAFAKRKCKIVLAARHEDKLKEVEELIKPYNSNVLSIVADVSKEEDCKRLVQESFNKYHRIDVLINNAGISMRAIFDGVDLKVLRQVMDTNFWGAVYCTKYALPYLHKTCGSIVGISSIAGKKGLPGRVGYCASKFALEGFLETVRIENMRKGLHVFTVCPGFTASNIRNTALVKDGSIQKESPRDEAKMMQPEEVAAAIVNGVIKRKRDIILTLQGRLTIFLNKFFPGWVDLLVYNHMRKEPDSPLK